MARLGLAVWSRAVIRLCLLDLCLARPLEYSEPSRPRVLSTKSAVDGDPRGTAERSLYRWKPGCLKPGDIGCSQSSTVAEQPAAPEQPATAEAAAGAAAEAPLVTTPEPPSRMAEATRESLENRDEAVAARDAKIAERDAENIRIREQIEDSRKRDQELESARQREESARRLEEAAGRGAGGEATPPEDQAAPMTVAPDAVCSSVSPSANDFWCQTNCVLVGHCSPTVCHCSSWGNATKTQEAEPVTQAETEKAVSDEDSSDWGNATPLAALPKPMTVSPDATCVSISPSANDFWCQTNCVRVGHCSPTVCHCSGWGNVTEAEPANSGEADEEFAVAGNTSTPPREAAPSWDEADLERARARCSRLVRSERTRCERRLQKKLKAGQKTLHVEQRKLRDEQRQQRSAAAAASIAGADDVDTAETFVPTACAQCGYDEEGIANCCSHGGSWNGNCREVPTYYGQHTFNEGHKICHSEENTTDKRYRRVVARSRQYWSLGELSRLYRNAAPSNNLSHVGLTVHCFDETEEKHEPWKPCMSGFCNTFQGRWSTSIIGPKQHGTYGGSGILMNPLYTKVMCSHWAVSASRLEPVHWICSSTY